jgi:DNA-binding transcriptional MerR regulator
MARHYRVQEFAALTGVTVKALHHYDRLGLLKPQRTAAGYRLYAERDMERLEQIVALKFLGLPLKQVKIVLERTALELPDALRMQREALAEKQELLWRAVNAIRAVEKTMENGKAADPAILKKLIEVIGMQNDIDAMKQYYSEEAWVKMRPRYAEGPSPEWIEMYREVEAALGEDPAGEIAQALAARWMELVEKNSGGDMEVRVGAMKAWADHRNWPAAMQQRIEEYHLDKIVPFIGQALAGSRKKYYSDAAWAKVTGRTQEEIAEIAAAWKALFLEVGAVLDEDPASERAQALLTRFMELFERSTGGDEEAKAGEIKAWADRANWPAHAQQQISSFRLDEAMEFLKRAAAHRTKKLQ